MATHGPGVVRISGATMTAPPRAPAAESRCGLDGGARREAGLLARRLPTSSLPFSCGAGWSSGRRSRVAAPGAADSTRTKSLGARVVGLLPPAGRPPSRQISRELEPSFVFLSLSQLRLQAVFLHFSPPETGHRPRCGWYDAAECFRYAWRYT
jgi:hypothetical protein